MMTEPADALKSPEALEEYLVGYFTDSEIFLTEDDVRAIESGEATWRSV
jgi:hypothetical protein